FREERLDPQALGRALLGMILEDPPVAPLTAFPEPGKKGELGAAGASPQLKVPFIERAHARIAIDLGEQLLESFVVRLFPHTNQVLTTLIGDQAQVELSGELHVFVDVTTGRVVELF